MNWTKYRDSLQTVYSVYGGQVFAIDNRGINRLAYALSQMPDLSGVNPKEISVGKSPKVPAVKGAIGVVPIVGTIQHHRDIYSEYGFSSACDAICEMFDQAIAMPEVGAVLLNIASYGGSVYGVEEASTHIFNARGTKPIIAVANAMACSAGYWIGSAADRFYVTPSGEGGSIGAKMVLENIAGMAEQAGVKHYVLCAPPGKAELNPYEVPTEEALALEQSSTVEVYYQSFLEAVARNRGVKKSLVESDFGQGRSLLAKQATEAGLFDGIKSFEQVVSEMGRTHPNGHSASRARAELAQRRIAARK